MQHLQEVIQVRAEHVLGLLLGDGGGDVDDQLHELRLSVVLRRIFQHHLPAAVLDRRPQMFDGVCLWRPCWLEEGDEVLLEVRPHDHGLVSLHTDTYG